MDNYKRLHKVKNAKFPPSSVATLTKTLQRVFNEYIRLRDKDHACISCGSWNELQAGHFYSAGHYSWMRFTEDNVHVQCKRCNYFLSGNLLEYRKNLLKRIGEERLQKLDLNAAIRTVKRYSRFELELLITYYQDKVKELKH